MLKSQIKVIEGNTPEQLTEKIDAYLKDGWKVLVGSYQIWADQGQRGYTTMMMKEQYLVGGPEELINDFNHDES